jgi:HlyD family secretion protein
MRRVITILVVLVVLGIAGFWAYRTFFAQPEADPLEEREEAIVERGTLVAMVNTTGTILPEKQTTLTFKTPGRVEEVLVEEGQAVRAGEVLARLETDDLAYGIAQAELSVAQAGLSVAQAEEGLALAEQNVTLAQQRVDQSAVGVGQAQAQLLRVQTPASKYDIAAAEAALESARASYRRLVDGPTAEEIRVARTNLDQAQAALDQAQAAYDQVADRPDVAMLPQSLQLEQATIAYEAAKANFELTQRDPSEAELAAARSAVVQAESALARLLEGVSDEDILVAQLQVEQAQLSLDQAQTSLEQAQTSRNQAQVSLEQARLSHDLAQLSLDQARHQLEGTVLTAPHEGIVTLVGVKVGEISGGQPAFVLTDLSRYHIDVTVDEIDIGRVAEGQAVTITLDALPGETLSGQIDTVADTAQLDAGVVTYKVTIALDPTDAPLRAGMTANADIVTELRQDVLLVPNRYVRIDRTSGQAFVDRADGDQVQSIEIQIGLRDEFVSEVLAGLEEGDMVVLIKESSREQLRNMMGPP